MAIKGGISDEDISQVFHELLYQHGCFPKEILFNYFPHSHTSWIITILLNLLITVC